MDYTGPVDNHMLLAVVDALSKWIEVFLIKFAYSATTIGKLWSLLATHGILESIVSDNGLPFTASEMKEFLTANVNNIITLSSFQEWTC